ncbi:hypothetical protein [Cupriavidus phytorum]|uniref:hypothetical protein n=1 Tax=Cupriavidus phytorum TaxID=3024399 RepID=UPI000E2EC12D|nr:hypothetical protein [Cupriavidus taiwanensis]
MRFYVDCEFTDFICQGLISIGIVAQNGEEFYAELCNIDESACSPFVREVVLPKLSRLPETTYTPDSLRVALLAWLAHTSADPEHLICVDNVVDWDLLIGVLQDVPAGWKGVLVGRLIDETVRQAYFLERGERHHALDDARALKAATPCDLAGAVSVAEVKPSRMF